jgi:penicillin-binding protein
MAELSASPEERIWKVFDNAKNPDWFYPVVTLPADAGDLSAQLTAIDGVLYQKDQGRVYPAGAAAGLVIGYIGRSRPRNWTVIPAKANTAQDKIGKMGLEQVYEARLRGSTGGEITWSTVTAASSRTSSHASSRSTASRLRWLWTSPARSDFTTP